MEIRKIVGDIKLYSTFLVLAIVFYFLVIPNQIYMSAAAKAEPFSPDTFPNAITILFIISCIAGLINSIIRYKKAIAKDGKSEKQKIILTKEKVFELAVPFVVLILIMIYVILFKTIGFILATIFIPPLILLVIRDHKWHHYLIFYVFAALMYILFKYALLVPIH